MYKNTLLSEINSFLVHFFTFFKKGDQGKVGDKGERGPAV